MFGAVSIGKYRDELEGKEEELLPIVDALVTLVACTMQLDYIDKSWTSLVDEMHKAALTELEEVQKQLYILEKQDREAMNREYFEDR